MPELTIGEAQIDRTVEMVMPTSVRWLFPELENGRELVEQNRDWLAPHFINERGHLLQSIHSLVVRVDGLVFVIDTCVGNDKRREGGSPEWHLRSGPFLTDLTATVDPATVDYVICTHLHVDHVGWNTRLVDGDWQPTFANARYLFVDRELAHWERLASGDAGTATLMDDSVRPVVAAGSVDQVESDHQISPSLRLEPSHGHTPGHVCVRISSGGEEAVVCGDVMHSPLQCAVPDARPVFDAEEAAARAARHTFLERYADSGVVVLGAHFHTPSAGRISRAGAAYRFDGSG